MTVYNLMESFQCMILTLYEEDFPHLPYFSKVQYSTTLFLSASDYSLFFLLMSCYSYSFSKERYSLFILLWSCLRFKFVVIALAFFQTEACSLDILFLYVAPTL